MVGADSHSASSSCSSPRRLCCSRNVDDWNPQNMLNISPRLSTDKATPFNRASSVELRREIAVLEAEILSLERYLLSLYRTAFEQHLPALPSIAGTHLECKTELPASIVVNGLHHNLDPPGAKSEFEGHKQPFPANDSLVADNQFCRSSFTKATSARGEKISDSGHRSLADHFGVSLMEKNPYTPDRLSEHIVRCMFSIYCRLANVPQAQPCSSASAASSLSSSSIFSSKTPCDSWSPCYSKESTGKNQFQVSKEQSGRHAAVIEVSKIHLDNDSFNYAAVMLENFRSLVRNLEKIDPRKMKREEKLAFWINIHNALVMHVWNLGPVTVVKNEFRKPSSRDFSCLPGSHERAYLAYGTHNRVKSTSIMRAEYNIGGHHINAYIIQSSILGIRLHHSAQWLQTLFSPGRKPKATSTKHLYALEYPEPLVHFALCSGAYSDPVVQVYSAEDIFRDLRLAKEEFIRSSASVYIHKEKKIFLPKVLHYFAKDMSVDMKNVVEIVSECLSEEQRKSIEQCMKGSRPEKYIHWLSQSSSFRYVIHMGQQAKEENMNANLMHDMMSPFLCT